MCLGVGRAMRARMAHAPPCGCPAHTPTRCHRTRGAAPPAPPRRHRLAALARAAQGVRGRRGHCVAAARVAGRVRRLHRLCGGAGRVCLLGAAGGVVGCKFQPKVNQTELQRAPLGVGFHGVWMRRGEEGRFVGGSGLAPWRLCVCAAWGLSKSIGDRLACPAQYHAELRWRRRVAPHNYGMRPCTDATSTTTSLS